jgi:predicted  nucleic acid-binding Zn-ribbon protein
MSVTKETTNNEESAKISEEEMRELRKKGINFYQEELKFLKLQHEYEKLQSEIEQFKTARLVAMLQAAQVYGESKKAETQKAESKSGTKATQTLKK